MPVEPLAGKVVIDTNNYYPQRDGHIPELDEKSATSSELLQRHLPTSQVVKAFNNIYFGHLGDLPRPAGAPDRSALPITGDAWSRNKLELQRRIAGRWSGNEYPPHLARRRQSAEKVRFRVMITNDSFDEREGLRTLWPGRIAKVTERLRTMRTEIARGDLSG